MFERYTERARQVIVLAQDSARNLKHNYIGSEHILLGILYEEEGIAARVLDSLGVTADGVDKQIQRIVGVGDEAVEKNVMQMFTPRAKKVLELALREALSLGHNYIGTEHILLGLVREDEGVASRILLDFNVDAETVRNELIRMLSGPGRQKAGAGSTLTGGDPIRISISKPGRQSKDEAVAVLPNGKTASNVYEAYAEGLKQGRHDALDCPVCGQPRRAHTISDVWDCLEGTQA